MTVRNSSRPIVRVFRATAAPDAHGRDVNGEVTLGVYPVHAKEKAFHYSVLAFSHGCISPVLKTAKANSLHWLGSNAANKRETGSTIKPTERIGSYISDRRV